jgi:hypothetical protein
LASLGPIDRGQRPALADEEREPNQQIDGAEQHPGPSLESKEGGADQGGERPEEADEQRPGAGECEDLGELLARILALEVLHEQQGRADRARLDEADKAETDRQGDQTRQ